METYEYARQGDLSLNLDLHMPELTNPSVVVFVHGGAWREGSRKGVPVLGLLKHGFAVASVDYRLSTQAQFPAQIHDIKAAIRFLRAKQVELHIDASRLFIIGASAGGHLAALVAVSHDVPALEGEVGEFLKQSSHVDGLVSFYGASNLETILSQSTDAGLKMRIPALQLLLGDLPENVPQLAKLASPVSHLDPKDPPVFLIHGDADPQMPMAQSLEFKNALDRFGVSSRFDILQGEGHGGDNFYSEERMALVAKFLSGLGR